MLQKQTIPLPLVRGIDRSTADQLRAPEALSQGLNVEQLKSGEITKRPGFTSVITPTGNERHLIGLNTSVAVINDTGEIEVLNDEEDTLSKLNNDGLLFNGFGYCTAEVSSLLGVNTGIENYETHIYQDNLFIYANLPSTGRIYRFDRNLNRLPYVIGGVSYPYINRPLPVGKFVGDLLFSGGQGTQLTAFRITTGTPVSASVLPTALPATSGASNDWDICASSSGGYIAAYKDATAIQIVVFDSNLSVVTSTTLSFTNFKLLSLVGGVVGNTFYLIVGRTNAAAAANRVQVYRYDEALSIVGDGTDSFTNVHEPYAISGVYGDSGDSWVFVEYDPTAPIGGSGNTYERYVGAANFSSALPAGSTFQIRLSVPRAGLASKPFILDTNAALGSKKPHVFLSYQSEDSNNLQNSIFLCTVPTSTFQAPQVIETQLQYGKSQNMLSTLEYKGLPSVPAYSDGQRITALFNRINSQFALSAANATFALVACTVTLDSAWNGSKGQTFAGQNVFAQGGIYIADSDQVTEYGFYVYPDPATLTQQAGGSLTASGTYSYVLVYEWYDSRGNLIESAPSAPVTATLTAGNQQFLVTGRIAGWSSKNAVRISFYRTLNGGTTYYYVTSASVVDLVAPSVVDDASDADIQNNRILYTTGGVAENISLSNPNFVTAAKNRLWAFENGTTDKLWFTKKPEEGFLPAFSDLLVASIPSIGGKIVGVAQLDDKLIVFKERRIYALFGDGPTANLQGDFSEPQAIVEGMGCISARSIVSTPNGVFYQSQEGIYAIDRSLQNQFAGRPLYKQEGSIITSAYDPILNRVLMLAQDKIWLLYLSNMAWYEWTATNIKSFVFESGVFWVLKDNGNGTADLMKLGSTYQDDGANYEQRIKLGQFQFAGIQGYQRLFRVLLTGANSADADASNVTVTTYINANTTPTDTLTKAHNSFVADNRTEIEIRPSKQRCESMEIQLSLTSNTSGLKLSAASAEVGGYVGAGRRSESRRI
jgi:hypothetical protein